MIIKSAAMTHIGKVRLNNQDNFYINQVYCEDLNSPVKAIEDSQERNYYTFAVCDGMGGMDHGELASLTALKVLKKYDSKEFADYFNEYVKEANNAVCSLCGFKKPVYTGTTIAVLNSDGYTANVLNLGDSRIYLFRDAELNRVSKDHTHTQNLVDIGIISQHEAEYNRKDHILTQYLGIDENEFLVEASTKKNIVLMSGDIFILCSDGLTDMLDEACICRIIENNRGRSPKQIVVELVRAAMKNGGRDNITVVVAKVY